MKNPGNRYDMGGMVVVTILMIIGLALIYFGGFFKITSFDEFYVCLCEYGLALIFGGFFFLVGIYCWYLYFKNVVIKPKKKVLYLKAIDENNMCTFLDKKGKKYYYPNNEYIENRYYEVLKTSNSISEVHNETSPLFPVPKVKESYWLNFYSPIGDFENIFLLPIVYVIFSTRIIKCNFI